MNTLTVTRSTVLLGHVTPPPPDGLALVQCTSCAAWHHNGGEVQLPMCEKCFGEFIGGGH
jgi:hypothetical protein